MDTFLAIIVGVGLAGGWISVLRTTEIIYRNVRWLRNNKKQSLPPVPPVDPTPYTSGAGEKPVRLVVAHGKSRACTVCPEWYDPATRPVDRFRYLACSDACCEVVEERFNIERLAVELPEETS